MFYSVMCESEFGFESGFKAFQTGFLFGFRPQRVESDLEVDLDSFVFESEVSRFGSGFRFKMPGFAHYWFYGYTTFQVHVYCKDRFNQVDQLKN